ncbi:MAG: hypothetical protein ACTTIC_05585 [Helicobacteraceae bacterium]
MKQLIFALAVCLAMADENFGIATKVKGKATLDHKILKAGAEVKIGQTLKTDKNSLAVITFDKSFLVANAGATLKFSAKNAVEQRKGDIYYKINPAQISSTLNGKNTNIFRIALGGIDIGVKGTDFIVKAQDLYAVFLRDGRLYFSSAKPLKIFTKPTNKNSELKEMFQIDNYKLKSSESDFTLQKNESVLIDRTSAYKTGKNIAPEEFKYYDDLTFDLN